MKITGRAVLVTGAFRALLSRSRGAVVNNLSMAGLAPVTFNPPTRNPDASAQSVARAILKGVEEGAEDILPRSLV
jgi:hypothetical protein